MTIKNKKDWTLEKHLETQRRQRINYEDIKVPQICDVPSIQALLRYQTHIAPCIMEAYNNKVPRPEDNEDIWDSIQTDSYQYYSPFEISVYGAYPLMSAWKVLEENVRLAYDAVKLREISRTSNENGYKYKTIDYKQYKKEKVLNRLRRFAEGFKYGYDTFIELILILQMQFQIQIARQDGIDRPVGDGAAGDDRQPVQGDPLGGHDRRALLLPARIVIAAPEDVLGQRLDPARVDPRRRPAPEPRGLDELGDHHPARLALDAASRPQGEAPAARAEVVAPARVAQPEVRQQPGEDRLMDHLRLGVRVVDLDPDALGRLADLARRGPATRGSAGSAGTRPWPACGTG